MEPSLGCWTRPDFVALSPAVGMDWAFRSSNLKCLSAVVSEQAATRRSWLSFL